MNSEERSLRASPARGEAIGFQWTARGLASDRAGIFARNKARHNSG